MNSTIGGIADQAALVRLVEQCVAIDDPFDGVIFEPKTISVEPTWKALRDARRFFCVSGSIWHLLALGRPRTLQGMTTRNSRRGRN